MADHERINDISHPFNGDRFNGERFWPLDDGVSMEGCPDCDLAIAHFLRGLELDLRLISLDLWTAGWAPAELLAEVRQAAGCAEASTLMAQVLLVDDSYRSEQARSSAWRDEIDALRSRTGISDVAPGWLTGWMVEQSSARQASACLKAVVTVLGDLVDPTAA